MQIALLQRFHWRFSHLTDENGKSFYQGYLFVWIAVKVAYADPRAISFFPELL
jgi:hypothetical protein